MKKFSIVINHIAEDKYAVVLRSWSFDEEGKEKNITSLVAENKSINEAIVIAENFIK